MRPPFAGIRQFKLQSMALAIGLCFAFSASAAQSEKERIVDLEKKLEKSMAMIEQLASRLNQLESSKPASVASVEAAKAEAGKSTQNVAAQQTRIDQLEQQVVQISENSAKRSELGLPLHGFADVGYVNTSKPVGGRKSGYVLGNLDLYLTPQFGDRVKSILELAFEYDERGNPVGTDLERLQMGYIFNDALTVWAGRFHSPYGYWNNAFHHGAQIQPSILRPRMIAFEDQGGILPSHTVGLQASGTMRLGQGRLGYDVYTGNGSRITGDLGDKSLDYNASKDDNFNKALGSNVRYSFGGELEGVTVGLHTLTEQVDEEGTGLSSKLNMAGGFFTVDRNNWELIGEYYNFRNKDLSGNTGTHGSWAGFVHAGYAINDFWTPYIRLEKANLDQTDNYFLGMVSGRSYKRQVAGVKYNLNAAAALKFEINKTNEQQPGGDNNINEARAQFSVRF